MGDNGKTVRNYQVIYEFIADWCEQLCYDEIGAMSLHPLFIIHITKVPYAIKESGLRGGSNKNKVMKIVMTEQWKYGT